MKPLLTLIVVLFLAGCRHGDTVTVEPEESDADVVVTSLMSVPEDSLAIPTDSIAILPTEQARFAGVVLLNDVKHDAGGEVRSGSFSWVYFADRARPFVMAGRVFGYYGLTLSTWQNPLTVNAQPMLKIPHRIRAFGMGYSWGVEYIRDMTGEYQTGSTFHWQASPDSVGKVDVSITTPDSLHVLFPKGGSRLPRTSNAVLQWTGQGNIAIIVGVVNPLTKRSKPLLQFRPRVNKGSLVISANILSSLATRGRFFVFTFVLANRKETTVVSRFSGEVLVQAATVYNSYVELY